MRPHRLTWKLTAIIAATLFAVVAIAATSAQQEPPHRFYGPVDSANPGDAIAVLDGKDHEIGSTTVAENGSWFIDVDRDNAEGVSFSINGVVAEAEITSTGSGQSIVTLTIPVPVVEEVDEDDSMMDEAETEDDGDSMSEDDEDSMMEDEPEPIGFPATGNGGLANNGAAAGIIGLLIAVVTAALAGIGLRRARQRS